MEFKTKSAEDLPYWQTGRSADKAITEAKNAIVKNGGKITGDGFISRNGEGAFFLEFEMHGDSFRVVEKIMYSRTGNENAAKIQAAASLKHSIKARVNEAVRHGARRAFMHSLLLPDGSTVDQKSNSELLKLFNPIVANNLLGEGMIEGEIEQ